MAFLFYSCYFDYYLPVEGMLIFNVFCCKEVDILK